MSLDPADPDINSHLGDAYWRTGRFLEADYQWRRVLTLEPDAPTRLAIETQARPRPAPWAGRLSWWGFTP